MTWTSFMDMHSGGGCKEPPYEYIYIELPRDMAEVYFYNRFGHSPERVTCTCCGRDYSLSESETLESATEYERRGGIFRDRNRTLTVDEYEADPEVLIIRSADIDKSMCEGYVPERGYVWRD